MSKSNLSQQDESTYVDPFTPAVKLLTMCFTQKKATQKINVGYKVICSQYSALQADWWSLKFCDQRIAFSYFQKDKHLAQPSWKNSFNNQYNKLDIFITLFD